MTDFGLFVTIVPGRDGLVHISSIDRAKQATLRDDLKIGDLLEVLVVSYDKKTDRIKLVAPSLEPSIKKSDH